MGWFVLYLAVTAQQSSVPAPVGDQFFFALLLSNKDSLSSTLIDRPIRTFHKIFPITIHAVAPYGMSLSFLLHS